MLITKSSIYNEIKVGPRYIYYNSLLNDNPALASAAQNYLQKHLNKIQASKDDNDSGEKIKSVIKLLEQALIQEQRAEIQFLKNNFLDNPLFKIFPTFYQKIYSLCYSTEQFDYIAVTAAINLAFQGLNNFKKNIELEQQRQRVLKKNIDNIIKDLNAKEQARWQEDQKNYYISRGGTYHGGEKNPFKQLLKDLPKTMAQKRTTRAEEIIRKIFEGKKDALISLINQTGANLITEEEILNYLLPYITEAILEDLDSSQIINEIEERIQNLSFQNFSTKGRVIKNLQSLESHRDMATGKISGLGLTQLFQDLNQDQNEELFELLDQALSHGKTKSFKERFNELSAKEEIKERLKKKPKETLTDKEKKQMRRPGEIRSGLSRSLSLALSKQTTYNNVSKIVSGLIVSINRPNYSEYISAIQGAIRINDSGVTVDAQLNLKNDFVITINIPRTLDKSINNALTNSLREEISLAEINFRQKKFGKLKTATTDAEATKIFKKVIDEKIAALKNAQLKSEQLEMELKRIKESIFIQGSVKDLTSFNNEIGFVGGTLGKDVATALDNLQNMYELGGITPLDAKWLLTAVVNTSSGALGKNLKQPIEKYLSFAAAMLMFNYGGSQIQYAAQELKTNIVPNSPSILNLYVLNSNYYPSSIVLEIVLNRLKETSNELLGVSEKYYSQTGVQINSTRTYNKDNLKGGNAAKTIWANEFKNALAQTSIDFTFLAGIMDMLNTINQLSFNI